MSAQGTDGKKQVIRHRQRALVFQGGGALGAYEAGAFRAFYDWLQLQTGEDQNLFDVIAGTSIGAINASILTSHVISRARKTEGIPSSQKACWNGAPDELEKFWLTQVNAQPISSLWVPYFQSIATFGKMSPWTNAFFRNFATQEEARKYYAATESIFLGSKGVFSPALPPIPDLKYFDFFFNNWYRSSNQSLKDTLNSFINFPIATQRSRNEPRLLTVAVDVVTSQAVAFDSYGTRELNSEGKPTYVLQSTFDESMYVQPQKTVTIKYDKGLAAEHVLASASVPVNFDFQRVPLEYDYVNTSANDYKAAGADIQNGTENGFRAFWDGGILSNTPLKELLAAHRDFWVKEIGEKTLRENIWEDPETTTGPLKTNPGLVPNLDVYMINVWPNEISPEYLPTDHDLTEARQRNITFGDKSKEDQADAELITDYVALIKRMREVALNSTTGDQQARKLQDAFNKILGELTNNNRSAESQTEYTTKMDLMLGVFDVEKVIRVERKADRQAIAHMALDFSQDTIAEMIGKGRNDALLRLVTHAKELIETNLKDLEIKKSHTTDSSELKDLDKDQNRLKGIDTSHLDRAAEIIRDTSDIDSYNKAMDEVEKHMAKIRDNELARLLLY